MYSMVWQPRQTHCSGLSEKGEQRAGLSVLICARLCRRRVVRKGIFQQIQPMPAKALSTTTCSAWNWHWPNCCPERILRPNWWLTLFIETTKAKKETSKTEFYGTNPKVAAGDPRPAAAMNGAGSACIFSLPPFYPDWLTDCPTQLTNLAEDAVGFWPWSKTSQSLSRAISYFTADSYPLQIGPKSLPKEQLACLAKASCDKRFHRYQCVLETHDNE